MQLPIPEPALLTNKTSVGVVVQAASTSGNSMMLETTDRHSELLLVYAPPFKRLIELSIHFDLASSGVDQRKTTITINRAISAGAAKS